MKPQSLKAWWSRVEKRCPPGGTLLASKLITIGAGLACFEMQPDDIAQNYRVAIPYPEPTRYVAFINDPQKSTPEIVALILTSHAYDEGPSAPVV